VQRGKRLNKNWSQPAQNYAKVYKTEGAVKKSNPHISRQVSCFLSAKVQHAPQYNGRPTTPDGRDHVGASIYF